MFTRCNVSSSESTALRPRWWKLSLLVLAAIMGALLPAAPHSALASESIPASKVVERWEGTIPVAIRLWREEMGNGPPERRRRVQHVLSGTTRHFPDWAAPIAYLQVTAHTKREIEE